MELVLSEQEEKTVAEFAQKIDLTDNEAILCYGTACQNRFAQFSDQVLKSVGDDSLEGACDTVAQLTQQLRAFSLVPEEKGLCRLFTSRKTRFTRWKARYEQANLQVEQLAGVLEAYQNRLLKSSLLLERLYDSNLTYYKELSMYIQAGQQCLAQAQVEQELRNRFERRLNDLTLTRTVSLQMAPQIRMVQENHRAVMEKLQTTLKNTIPLWKNQMLLALGLNSAQQALEVQRQAGDAAVAAVKRNAGALKASADRLRQETGKHTVDVKALQSANQALVQSLDGVLLAQSQEQEKRSAAEHEISQMENRIRQLAQER